MHPDDETVTWTMDAGQVARLWSETRQVFGNKLWFDSVCAIVPDEWQAVLEERSGEMFFDVVGGAVDDDALDRSEPSLVLRALRDAFAGYGVTLVFAPHPLHGDVLHRAAGAEAGTLAPDRSGWDLDEDEVVDLWNFLTECAEFGWTGNEAEDLVELLPAELIDAYERKAGIEARITLSDAFENVDEDTEPPVILARVQRVFAADGITVRFAPHPVHGR